MLVLEEKRSGQTALARRGSRATSNPQKPPSLDVTFRTIRPLMEAWISCVLASEQDASLKKIAVAAPWLDMKCLELARIWSIQLQGPERYTTDTISHLYKLAEQNPTIPLGPISCHFSPSVKAIERQIRNANYIIGDEPRRFYAGESLPAAMVERYTIRKGPHPCQFGTGLITYSLYDGELKLYQVSFYPSSPFKVFEIKGASPEQEASKAKAILRSVHRFHSKFEVSASTALVGAVMATAARLGEAVDIAEQASRWRNNHLIYDKGSAVQADKQHLRVLNELDPERLSGESGTEPFRFRSLSASSCKNWAGHPAFRKLPLKLSDQ